MEKHMRIILQFLKPYKLQIIVAYAFTLTELIAELLFPLFLGIMINDDIMAGRLTKVVIGVSVMTSFSIIYFSSGIFNSYFSYHVGNATSYDIREKLFDKLQRFSFDILNFYPTSMVVTRFTNDVRQIQNMIFMSLRIMMRAPLMVIGSIFMSFII